MFYSYRHTLTLADSNAVGNIYFAEIVALQGKCREAFLTEYAPHTARRLLNHSDPVHIITKECSQRFMDELYPFDVVELRLSSGLVTNIKIEMLFDVYLVKRDHEQLAEPKLISTGRQLVKCLPHIPDELLQSVNRFKANSPRLKIAMPVQVT